MESLLESVGAERASGGTNGVGVALPNLMASRLDAFSQDDMSVLILSEYNLR